MPRTIALVVWGRCRPSPDAVPEGAPADRDARGIVAAGFPGRVGGGFLPVLRAPSAGVGRVDGDDGDAEFGRHADEPGPQLGYGHAGDHLPEPLLAPVLLPGFLRAEVEVFDRNRQAVALGPVQEPDQCMPYLGITMHRGAGQVVEEPARLAAWVAVLIEAPGGEVVGVGVDTDQTAGAGYVEGDGLDGWDGPGGGEVPAGAVCVVVDAVGHGPVRGDAVGPLLAAVMERHSRGQDIAPVFAVCQVCEW